MKKNLKGLFILLLFTTLFICLFAVNSYASEYEFDVTDDEFGAVPNDEIDDYDAINNALKKARDIDEEITVYVPAGEYLISEQLYIYSDTKLLLDDNAIIKSTSSTDMVSMIMGLHEDLTDDHGGYTRIHDVEISGGTWDRNSNSNVISTIFVINHGENISIHDLVVQKSTEHMIDISACKNVNIDNVTLQNQVAYTGTNTEYWGDHSSGDTTRHGFSEAIHTDYAGEGEQGALPLDNTICQQITINECTFDSVLAGIGNHHETEHKANIINVIECNFINTKYGAAVNAWSFDNLIITNNTLTGSDLGVISVDSTGQINDNSFTATNNGTENSVITMEDSEFAIRNNTIENASKFAIRTVGGVYTIAENTINSVSTDAIRIDDTTSLHINNNTISNTKRYGIYIKGCTGENTIKSNTIKNELEEVKGQSGILVENCENNNTIEENTISGYFDNHIYLINSIGKMINNILNNSVLNTIQLNNSTAVINSNRINNAGSNAIYMVGGEAVILSNEINGTSTDGIRVDGTTNITISANKINNNTRYGVFITNTTNNVNIANNQLLTGNPIAGIYIEKCHGTNTIDNNTVKCGSFTGILAFKCNGTISNNIVTSLSGDAVQTMGDSDNIATFEIKDNLLQTASTSNYDIRLNSYSRNCKVNNNVLGNRGLTAASGVTYTQTNFTGIRKDANGVERYYKDGKQDNSSGLVNVSGTWYYLNNGLINKDYLGLVCYNNSWFYVENGKINWSYTGLVEYCGNWFYVQKGRLIWGERTLVNYIGTWFYVNDSIVDWKYTGLVDYNNSTFYVQGGILKWGVTTLKEINGTWYYLNNSYLAKDYTGLVEYSGNWFYVQKGILKWGERTLVNYKGTWFYVNNSYIDWKYTGLVQYNGTWFYVQGGILKWGVRTLVEYNKNWFYVDNSSIDWSYTGLVKYGNNLFYIQGGVLKWGYNGTATYNGVTYQVENSIAKK